MGYGDEDIDNGDSYFSLSDKADKSHDVILLDDAALYFRYYKKIWPQCIQPRTDKNQKETEKPKQIIMWMSNPIAMGDLWYQVSGCFNDETIVIVSADDIRFQNVIISKGKSWERTALDLINELEHNSAIRDLKKCAHLIVLFNFEGALWFNKSSKEYKLFFDPANLEGEWAGWITGKSFGYSACFMAGFNTSFNSI